MSKRKRTKEQTTIYKTYNKTKDRVTQTPLKTGGELRCSGRISSSCPTSGTRRVNIVSYKPDDKSWMRKNRDPTQYSVFVLLREQY